VRLSELLGADVVTSAGRDLGHVHDVQLVQDGPIIGEWGAALRVRALVVGRRSIGTRLGYDQDVVHRPWILRLLFGRQRPDFIPWSAVLELHDDRIVVSHEAEPATAPM
jgi:sporulation protein YlmC with PRC-barrel domain